MKELCRIFILGVFALLASQASANTYSITGDFSNTTNPNGVWTYGRLDALDGVFTAYPNAFSAVSGGATINAWNDPNYYLVPLLWNNASGFAYSDHVGTLDLLPGWAGFYPGPAALSVFRFTAPVTSTYGIVADFQGADSHGTSSSVFIHKTGSDLYSASISGNGDATRQSYSGSVFLNAGSYLDFAVSGGSNCWCYDATAVRATVSAPVPEPGTYALLLAGLGLIGLTARRRNGQFMAR